MDEKHSVLLRTLDIVEMLWFCLGVNGSSYWGFTQFSLPGNAPADSRPRTSFIPSCGTVDQHFTSAGLVEGSWEFVHLVLGSVDLEKTYDPPSGSRVVHRTSSFN